MPSPSHRPLVSVVIPSRDTRELTLACLGSLAEECLGEQADDTFRLGPETIEILVVDDASRDGTEHAIGERFSGVQVVRNHQPRGFTISANRGLTAAAGELLLLLNSDTEVRKGALAALVAAFRERPTLGIAGAALRYPDGTAQWSGGDKPSNTWLFALASGLPALVGKLPGYRAIRPVRGTGTASPAIGSPIDWVTGAAMMIRSEVWRDLGPLDESFDFYCQDLDYCLRAGRAGWEVRVVAGAEVVHHHGASIAKVAAGGLELSDRPPAAGLDGVRPQRLWADLIRWARKEDGPMAARAAARWLRLGTRLRLVGRSLRGLSVTGAKRELWTAKTEEFRQALAETFRS